MKTCSTCKKEKLLGEYYKHKSYKDGHRSTCKSCCSLYEKDRYLKLKNDGNIYIKNKQETVRKSNLMNAYGLSIEKYDELLIQQNHCCAVCEKHTNELKRRLSVDHCHETGFIRGLLCDNCNQKLISNRTDPNIFMRAYYYMMQNTGLKIPEKEHS